MNINLDPQQARDGEEQANRAIERIDRRSAVVGIIGAGYVGLPLAAASARAGFRTVAFDTDIDKVTKINRGESYIDAIGSEELLSLSKSQKISATTDFTKLAECDVVIICVPTPLTRQREPDLSAVENSTRLIAAHLQPGQLVVLESTTYPGTTREIVKPLLEATGMRSGIDFFIGFSPEREDPGNRQFATVSIPKVVAGEGEGGRVVAAFYGVIVDRIVPVSTLDVAEAVKISENIFRAVNIALANELKVVFGRMGIDVWEVIEAAKTKPFGYMPYYPGPGLGGHCIPIDPFYLTWKAREYGVPTRFIELAGEINTNMPRHVIGVLQEALDRKFARALSASRILVIGLAYKKNIGDLRESPSLELMEILEERGTAVDYHDPHIARIMLTRDYPALAGKISVALEPEALASYDAVLIATDHDAVDYGLLCEHAKLVVDTRNACRRAGVTSDKVILA